MSCDTNYQIAVFHSDKKRLQELKRYCQYKQERWDLWQASGKTADELVKELGEADYNDVVSWGYHWGSIRKFGDSYKMMGTSWANENCSNLHIKGSKGELASIARKFPDVEWEVEFEDEYGWTGFLREPLFEP
jgi:hypothetical protein